jgi:hypothetical protein
MPLARHCQNHNRDVLSYAVFPGKNARIASAARAAYVALCATNGHASISFRDNRPKVRRKALLDLDYFGELKRGCGSDEPLSIRA